MPRPGEKPDFESARLRIRRGTLAQTGRRRAEDAAGPLEPDELFAMDELCPQGKPEDRPDPADPTSSD